MLLLALQAHGACLYGGHEALADGCSEQLVLLVGDVHLVEVGVLDLVLGVLVLVPEHGEVAVAVLYGVVDGVDEAAVVLAALGDVVGAGAGGAGHVVAHDGGDELGRLVAAIVERLVRVRVGLEDEADVGLERGELGAVVAVPVVGEGGHHLGELFGEHVASLVALGDVRLRRACPVAQRHAVRRRAAIACHGSVESVASGALQKACRRLAEALSRSRWFEEGC